MWAGRWWWWYEGITQRDLRPSQYQFNSTEVGGCQNYLRDDRGDLRGTESDGGERNLLYPGPVSWRGGDLEKDLIADIFHHGGVAELP